MDPFHNVYPLEQYRSRTHPMHSSHQIRFLTADPPDPANANRDVIVHLPDGREFTATFYTPANLAGLLEREDGHYSDPNMVIVADVRRETISETIAAMLKNGTFHKTFLECRKY